MRNRSLISAFIALPIVILYSGILLAAEVKNETVRQEGSRVVFEYNLEGEGESDISVSITMDGKRYDAKDIHLEGDYGKVKSGKGKRIYWNVLQDFPKGLSNDIKAVITAGGGAKLKIKPEEGYTDNGNGTVTDNKTGLMWQKDDDGRRRNWKDAVAYCEGLSLGGYYDWRMPDIDELVTLIVTGNRPTINISLFPNTKSSAYWSTTSADYTSWARCVDFSPGYVVSNGKANNHLVRCARGRQ